MSSAQILEHRWSTFVAELDACAAGGTLPVELPTLPLELIAAGEGARLRAVEPALVHALRMQAALLAPTSVGPRHHAFAELLDAVAGVDVALDPVLTEARRLWARPPRRPSKSYTLDELTPFTPTRKR